MSLVVSGSVGQSISHGTRVLRVGLSSPLWACRRKPASGSSLTDGKEASGKVVDSPRNAVAALLWRAERRPGGKTRMYNEHNYLNFFDTTFISIGLDAKHNSTYYHITNYIHTSDKLFQILN